jgi:hypothetical protein
MEIFHIERAGKLVNTAMKKIVFQAFFFTFLLNASLVYFCIAQEPAQSQPTSAQPSEKSTEAPISPPSLSSLLAQTVIFIYEDNMPQVPDIVKQKNPGIIAPGKVLG